MPTGGLVTCTCYNITIDLKNKQVPIICNLITKETYNKTTRINI